MTLDPLATPLLGGRDILTFANDWTADPTSKHHIMRRFSRTNDVLWVEAAGMRAPSLTSAYDRKRLLLKAKAILRKSRPVLERVHAMTPPALPYPHSSFAKQANALLYQFTIARGQCGLAQHVRAERRPATVEVGMSHQRPENVENARGISSGE